MKRCQPRLNESVHGCFLLIGSLEKFGFALDLSDDNRSVFHHQRFRKVNAVRRHLDDGDDHLLAFKVCCVFNWANK